MYAACVSIRPCTSKLADMSSILAAAQMIRDSPATCTPIIFWDWSINISRVLHRQENVRTTSLYLFGQDSWKIRPNVTLNYGLRWELNTPLTDIGHHVQTFRPGQTTTTYPCQISPYGEQLLGTTDCTSSFPTGLVVPGDKGIPAGLTQTYYKAFAPRIGIAYSPFANNKTSIHAGWGMFYNPIEQLVLEQFSAEPPFGGSTFCSTLSSTHLSWRRPVSRIQIRSTRRVVRSPVFSDLPRTASGLVHLPSNSFVR